MTSRNPNVRKSTGDLQPIGELLKDIVLDTKDPVAQGGFTQIPNFVLQMGSLSAGAKVAYAMFLRYAWHNDYCFPGQERLGKDIGVSRSRVSEYITELKDAGLVSVKRRGLNQTNIYKIHFKVKKKRG